jgi:cytochrome c oxidase subunit 5a
MLCIGIKAKVENKGQYDEYLRDLEPLREELGVNLKEDLYPEQLFTAGANTHG